MYFCNNALAEQRIGHDASGFRFSKSLSRKGKIQFKVEDRAFKAEAGVIEGKNKSVRSSVLIILLANAIACHQPVQLARSYVCFCG